MQEQTREDTKESYALALINLMMKDNAAFVYTEFTVHDVQHRYFNFNDRANMNGLKLLVPDDVVDWEAAWLVVDEIELILLERESRKSASEALSKKLDEMLTEDERQMVVVVK